MNDPEEHRQPMAFARTTILVLAALGLMLGTARGAIIGSPPPEERVELLQTPAGTFTNVLIMSKSQSIVFIQHAGGLTSLKVRDLDKSTQLQLGYQLVPESAAGHGTPSEDGIDAGLELTAPDLTFALDPRYEEMLEQWSWEAREHLAALSPVARYGGMVLGCLGYLFFCFCAHLLCRKAGLPATPLVWVPWLQLIPLARAAGLSWMWFLGALVPGLNVLGYCWWAFRIAAARGKGQWLGWMLLLPGLNVLGFLILAFADSASAQARGPRKVVVLNQPPRRRAA